jgi:hypothetical protein
VSIRVHFLDDRRKALYGEIFPDGVPVKGPVPTLCELGDIGEHLCYTLDAEEIGPTQLAKLGGIIARQFEGNPETVITQLLDHGMPIIADQTTMVIDGRHLGLLMPDAVAEDGLVSIRGRYMADEDDWDDEGYDWLYDEDDEIVDDDGPEDSEPPPDNVNEIPF